MITAKQIRDIVLVEAAGLSARELFTFAHQRFAGVDPEVILSGIKLIVVQRQIDTAEADKHAQWHFAKPGGRHRHAS